MPLTQITPPDAKDAAASKETPSANPFEKLNIQAKTFVPAAVSATPATSSSMPGDITNSGA